MSTLQDVANRAGTSIATVSHVIHHTRFVSEELREKVEEAMRELDYTEESNKKIILGFLLRNYRCSLAEDMIDAMNVFYRSQNVEVISILVPSQLTLQDIKTYQKRYQLDYMVLDYTVQLKKVRQHKELELPIIFMNHDPEAYPKCFHINFDYHASIIQALRHLMSLGHKDILVFTPSENPYTNSVVLNTCMEVYHQNNMAFPKENLAEFDTFVVRNEVLPVVGEILAKHPNITAIITTEMMATMHVVEYLRLNGINMPQDISLLAIGDIYLTRFLFFNRTRIDMRIMVLTKIMGDIILKKTTEKYFTVSPDFFTGDTTKALVYDQFGRAGASQLSLELSESDVTRVREGDFKVCISFYNMETPVSKAQMEGLRDGLNTLGIHLVQQTDAHGNYEIQNLQIQGFVNAKPDAVICIPNMDENELLPYKNAFPRRTKHLFSSAIPNSFTANQYDTCVTSNAVESGKQAAMLLGNYMKENNLTHAAYLCVGGTSLSANHRDQSALSIMQEEFPSIKVEQVAYYRDDTQMYALVQKLLEENPSIQAMYISQCAGAEAVLGILPLLKREDIKIVTQGLRKSIIEQLDEHSNVVGLVAPNAYEIGRLLAFSCARMFLGTEYAPYVAVDPVSFKPQNLNSAWLSVMKNKLT